MATSGTTEKVSCARHNFAADDTWRIDMNCAFPGPTATRWCSCCHNIFTYFRCWAMLGLYLMTTLLRNSGECDTERIPKIVQYLMKLWHWQQILVYPLTATIFQSRSQRLGLLLSSISGNRTLYAVIKMHGPDCQYYHMRLCCNFRIAFMDWNHLILTYSPFSDKAFTWD